MFKINDYVVYGSMGVHKITDIQKADRAFSDESGCYYVLHPVYNDNITIKIPVRKQNVFLRSVITQDDVLSLIASMPEKEIIAIEDERQRYYMLKTALKTGNNEERIKIIKTLYLEKKKKIAVNKKLTKLDEDIINTAEKQLHEEFAIALNITPDEVLPYILEHIPHNEA